jgi:ABC-type Fe3+/spermidine/putrescine transport system ATPase subunit
MIEVISVSYRYGKKKILNEVSLRVNTGECLALLGPSGCGKTTLLRLIAGLEKPSAGQIRLNGTPASTPKRLLAPYRRSVGMVFQDLALWPHMRVHAQVDFALGSSGLPKTERASKVMRALQCVRLDGFQRSYPHQLSGGEKQRLALARALVCEPQILLLDEPLSSLDSDLKNELLEEITDIVNDSKMTAIYVTHDWNEAICIAGRIARMKDGYLERICSAEKFSPAQNIFLKN